VPESTGAIGAFGAISDSASAEESAEGKNQIQSKCIFREKGGLLFSAFAAKFKE
jgi:hypothetical protein